MRSSPDSACSLWEVLDAAAAPAPSIAKPNMERAIATDPTETLKDPHPRVESQCGHQFP